MLWSFEISGTQLGLGLRSQGLNSSRLQGPAGLSPTENRIENVPLRFRAFRTSCTRVARKALKRNPSGTPRRSGVFGGSRLTVSGLGFRV